VSTVASIVAKLVSKGSIPDDEESREWAEAQIQKLLKKRIRFTIRHFLDLYSKSSSKLGMN
jgi:hypothetical protein